MGKVDMTKNKNRRVSFRIYEEVDLFYQKIDEKQATEPRSALENIFYKPLFSIDTGKVFQDLPAPERNLPDLSSNEHETCDVNISESGMAFYCIEAFKEGDYLAFKILLPASMATIMACGKVVNCKDSNPYESHEPYQVRVSFIEMEDEGRELLGKYVNKIRWQHIAVNVLILFAVITVVSAPDMVFGLVLELIHFLFEHLLEFIHIVFELIESNLDHLVEHFFETDVHQTQIIVFYIIMSFVFYGLYRLWRVVPPFFRRCKNNLIAYCLRKKASLQYYWGEQTLFDKCKLVVISVAAITAYVLFGM